MLEELDLILLSFECIFSACAAAGTEKDQLVSREIPFFEDLEELLSYSPAYTYDCYFHGE